MHALVGNGVRKRWWGSLCTIKATKEEILLTSTLCLPATNKWCPADPGLWGRESHWGDPSSAGALGQGCDPPQSCGNEAVIYLCSLCRECAVSGAQSKHPQFRKQRFGSLSSAMEDTVCCGFWGNRSFRPSYLNPDWSARLQLAFSPAPWPGPGRALKDTHRDVSPCSHTWAGSPVPSAGELSLWGLS